MSQAIVDPNELRRFAHQLERFSSELESQMLMLRGQLNALGQSWRDQENEKFMQEFDETLAATNRFLEATRQHVPFLLRKAERVEEYLAAAIASAASSPGSGKQVVRHRSDREASEMSGGAHMSIRSKSCAISAPRSPPLPTKRATRWQPTTWNWAARSSGC